MLSILYIIQKKKNGAREDDVYKSPRDRGESCYYYCMKKCSKSGFVIPIIIAIIALSAAGGVWYNVGLEKSKLRDMSQVEQDAAELFVASQLGFSTNKVSFVSGNARHARFVVKDTNQSVFALREDSVWKVVEPKDGKYSCEQLKVMGFTGSFLYDCETKYEQKSAMTLLTDSKEEAILVGFLKAIDECGGCVQLTTDQNDKVTFFLDEEFDNGDYVAVNIPDSEIISINGVPQSVTSDDGEDAESEDSNDESSQGNEEQGVDSEENENTGDDSDQEDEGQEAESERDESEGENEENNDSGDSDTNNTPDPDNGESDDSGGNTSDNQQNEDQSEGDNGGASIVEEIVDADDVDESQGEPDDFDENTGDGSDQNSEEPEPESEGDESQREDEEGDNEDNNDTVFDEEDDIDDGDQDIINFFDLDSIGQDIQVIGDPSEDRR